MSSKDIYLHYSNNLTKTLALCKENSWSCIPVKDKKPLVKWSKYQTTLPTEKELESMFKNADEIALITGSLSGIIVLDIDGPEGKESIKDKYIPWTVSARTKNDGIHYYFKHPNKKIKTDSKILNSVDIRGDGGYVVMPESNGYEWIISPEEHEIADIPDWLLELVIAEEKTTRKRQAKKPKTDIQYLSLFSNNAEPVKLDSQIKLREWYSQDIVAKRFMEHYGIDKEIGQAFNCVLPSHDDCSPSSSLVKGDNGLYVYRDWHGATGEQILLLQDVYASGFYKRIVSANKGFAEKEIGRPEQATWGIRMLVDLGFILPYEVDFRPLEGKVPKKYQKTYTGFIKLLQCKWLHTPNEPTAFSYRFASAWSGVGVNQVGECVKWLLENGYIKAQGEYSSNGKKMSLFITN